MMLLHFLRWLRNHDDIEMRVLLVHDGELFPSFADLAPVITMVSKGHSPRDRFLRRVSWTGYGWGPPPEEASWLERSLRLSARKLFTAGLARDLRAFGPFTLAYLNSVHAGAALSLLPPGLPVLTHVHELGYQIDQSSPAELAALTARTDRYIAAADCARTTLIEKLGVAPSKISVCHEFIPIDRCPPDPSAVGAVREQLGIAPETLIVGAAGAIGWVKGADLLIHVARRVINAIGSERDVAFIWAGHPQRPWHLRELEYDIKEAGLSGQFRFVGAYSDLRPVMALFDVFALPSRLDTFPLVCLEAASLAKPIVCFDAGGMREFLEPQERLLIPYLSIESMAQRIVELLRSRTERETIGRSLAERVRERHDINVGAPKLNRELSAMIAAQRTVVARV